MNQYIEERNDGDYVAAKRVSLESIVAGFNGGESPETIQQNVWWTQTSATATGKSALSCHP
jgi:hypothetical protein